MEKPPKRQIGGDNKVYGGGEQGEKKRSGHTKFQGRGTQARVNTKRQMTLHGGKTDPGQDRECETVSL